MRRCMLTRRPPCASSSAWATSWGTCWPTKSFTVGGCRAIVRHLGRFARRRHLPSIRHARHREGHRRVPSEVPNANPAHPLRQGLRPLHGAIMELDIDGLSLDWRDDLRAYRASHGKRLACKATSIRPSCTAQPKPRSAPRKRCSRPLAMRPDTSSTSGMALPQAPALNALKPFFAPWRGGDAPAHDRSCSPRTGPHL